MKNILISVDTEGPAGDDPVKRLIYGETEKGTRYGIEYLMDLFNTYNARALFFVDIAEAWDFGKEKIVHVLHDIERGGHDIGVHIHPDHMADPNRKFLWQYSLEEQTDIIQRCTDLYSEILGKNPVSFRAGRYGANNDTIKILDKIGYKFDMSEFYGNRRCRIEPFVTLNRVRRFENFELFEVPVTVYKSFSTPFYSRIDKVDCSMDFNEFKKVMEKIKTNKEIDVVSFFVHSFSVLNWRSNPDRPKLSKRLKDRLENQLRWCSLDEDIEFIEEKELICTKGNSEEEIIDISQNLSSYWFFLKRANSILHDKIVLNI